MKPCRRLPFPNPGLPEEADPFPNPALPEEADPFANPALPEEADPFPNPALPEEADQSVRISVAMPLLAALSPDVVPQVDALQEVTSLEKRCQKNSCSQIYMLVCASQGASHVRLRFVSASMSGMQVGVWSEECQEWQPEHVAEAAVTGATVQFRARRLGAFALLQPCSALLPYSAWCLRPIGGPAPSKIALNVTTGALDVEQHKHMLCCHTQTNCTKHMQVST